MHIILRITHLGIMECTNEEYFHSLQSNQKQGYLLELKKIVYKW